ncbi:MAG: hypothetical protein R3E01_05460 [Pirellulaceae bacterium]
MDPFTITCTTCQTRLRVKSAAAIGKILGCPKCGSMNMVTPPTTDNVSVGSSFDHVSSIFGPEDDQGTMGNSRSSESISSTEETFNLGPAGDVLSSEVVSREAVSAIDPPLLPSDQWVSPRSIFMRRVGWTLGSVAAGAAVAVCGFAWIYSHSADTTNADTTNAVTTNADTTDAVPTNDVRTTRLRPVLPQETPQFPPDDAEMDDRATLDVRDNGVEELPTVAIGLEAGGESVTALDPPQPNEPTVDVEGEEPVPSDADAPIASGSDSQTVDNFSKFVDVWNVVDPVGTQPEENPAAEAPHPEDQGIASTGSVDQNSVDSVGNGEDSAVVSGPTKGPLPDVDVAARLQDPIDRLVIAQDNAVTFASFVRFFSRLTTIPVTVDPEALQFVNLSPDKKVTVNLSDGTAAGLMEAVLAGTHLSYVIQQGQVRITRGNSGQMRTATYGVGDLLEGNDEDKAALLALFKQMVAPGTWKDDGGSGRLEWSDGKLAVTQSEAAHFETLLLCEKLRVARGLSPRSRYPDSLFRLEPLAEQAGPLLNQLVSFRALRPQPFRAIVERMEEAGNCRIWVDWMALAEEGWGPLTEQSVVLEHRRLADALAELLAPMGLTYRIVDKRTLEITTHAAEWLRPRIEFYRIEGGDGSRPAAGALVEHLRQEIEGQWGAERAAKVASLAYDPVSRLLLVRAPQSQQEWVGKRVRDFGSTP